ncbi:MAG: hypothetical protein RRY65_01485 [Pseudoflavonifractor sp.]
MYNRYIPSGSSFKRVAEEDNFPPKPQPEPAAAEPEKKEGLAGLLKGLLPEGLDKGDILLLLILLFLFLEGDDMELVITLGLMVLLSFQ